MLEHVWIIPALTFASFWLTLFFGKRLPGGGWQIGVALVGIAFALFVIAIAAAEVGVGLAIVLLLYRNRRSIDLDEVAEMKG